MRILLALFLSLAVLGSIQASEGRKWSRYDKVTLDMNYLDHYYINDNYQINLLSTSEGTYHCYLVKFKHNTFYILTEVEFDLAAKCFPFLMMLKDQYAGPKQP